MATTTEPIIFDYDGDYGTLPTRKNADLSEPCSSCGLDLRYDRHEDFVYCLNDWYHG
jgi:hypothetical protein